MDRKEFIKTCTHSCLGLLGLSLLLEACKPGQYVQVVASGNRLQVKKSDFILIKNDKQSYKKNVIVSPENLDFPIAVYRFSETDYSALLLSCTHRGTELSVNGDILSCPAHNAEFSNRGEVIQGPAEKELKTFNVTHDEQFIYIHLV